MDIIQTERLLDELPVFWFVHLGDLYAESGQTLQAEEESLLWDDGRQRRRRRRLRRLRETSRPFFFFPFFPPLFFLTKDSRENKEKCE